MISNKLDLLSSRQVQILVNINLFGHNKQDLYTFIHVHSNVVKCVGIDA